eukprot:3803760-Prymnesium_polylepis.1
MGSPIRRGHVLCACACVSVCVNGLRGRCTHCVRGRKAIRLTHTIGCMCSKLPGKRHLRGAGGAYFPGNFPESEIDRTLLISDGLSRKTCQGQGTVEPGAFFSDMCMRVLHFEQATKQASKQTNRCTGQRGTRDRDG